MENFEIERKYLVKNDSWKNSNLLPIKITQGYILNTKNKSIRIRICESILNKAYITIKMSTGDNLIRKEFEYEIPFKDAIELLNTCEDKISKNRYVLDKDGFKYEIDEFLEKNLGLVVVEIELKNENESPTILDFIGEEITYDNKYINASLALNPYTSWI